MLRHSRKKRPEIPFGCPGKKRRGCGFVKPDPYRMEGSWKSLSGVQDNVGI